MSETSLGRVLVVYRDVQGLNRSITNVKCQVIGVVQYTPAALGRSDGNVLIMIDIQVGGDQRQVNFV
jgi:hypothetical protein